MDRQISSDSNDQHNNDEPNTLDDHHIEAAADECSGTGGVLRRRKGKLISCAKETIENGLRFLHLSLLKFY